VTLYVIEPIESDDDTPPPEPQGAQRLGHAAGVRWYQGSSVPAEGRPPTDDEMATAMLELPAIRSLKAAARRKIEAEVGDVHEILADQARQIEALTALVSRMAADYLGGTAMGEATKEAYLARAEHVVAALDSGALTLRGDAEGANDMLEKVMARADRINRIVAADYLPRRNALLND
jgi:hypothetical protein